MKTELTMTESYQRNCAKALQKQVPMRVKDIGMYYFKCPACGREDSTFDVGQAPGYCRNCGQALY